MSRILKRPMFRVGGSANNEGIISGVVPTRAGYAEPQGVANELDNYKLDTSSDFYKKALRNAAILSQFAGTGRSQSDRLSDLLIRGGLRTMSETPRGGLFPTLAKAFQEPVEQYLKSGEAEDAFQRQIRLAGASQAMTSEEAQAKYDKELKIAEMKLEQDAKEAFIKVNQNTLGVKAAGVYDTMKKLKKNNVSVSELPVTAIQATGKGGVKVAKPDPQDVASIPQGQAFYDSYGNFYKRVEGSPGWVRIQTSGKEIPAPPTPVKPPSFSDSPGAAYDPRAWNKQKFYESLLNKNKASME